MIVEGNYVFGKLKQNFRVDQRVVIGRTNDDSLDGLTGTIVGISIKDSICDFYIILLDQPYNGWKAITLIESCICPID
jgi:hypothetical protein